LHIPDGQYWAWLGLLFEEAMVEVSHLSPGGDLRHGFGPEALSLRGLVATVARLDY
jgi:hypothetical protein